MQNSAWLLGELLGMGDAASADGHYPMVQIDMGNSHNFTIKSKRRRDDDKDKSTVESSERAIHLVVK